MPRGLSLHIGVNEVDANQYGGEFRRLRGCVNDAETMEGIADSQGFAPRLLLRNQEATASNVIGAIREAAQQLNDGDLFLLTYSGHGSHFPDSNGDEEDNSDETLVLYDRHLIDDELTFYWAEFRAGVRIFMVSDSCHSGTVFHAAFASGQPLAMGKDNLALSVKHLDNHLRDRHFRRFRSNYNAILNHLSASDDVAIRASVMLLAACQDHEETRDNLPNGEFTKRLKRVWDEGGFHGNYHQFRAQIAELFGGSQEPQLNLIGNSNPNFEGQRPFSI